MTELTLHEALEIVLVLAEHGALEVRDIVKDNNLEEQYKIQQRSLDAVYQFVNNWPFENDNIELTVNI